MADAPRHRFVWYDLMTTDPAKGTEFYTQLIGWGTQAWEGPMPYEMWTNEGKPLGGVMELPEDAKKGGAPPHWLAYVNVDDVDATVEQATGLGANVLVPGTEIPNAGKFAVLMDPQGAAFAVFSSDQESHESEGPAKVGEFSWHELATTDYGAAFDFYNALFGWEKTEAMDMGDAGIYQMYGGGGEMLGGMFNKPAEMPGPPFWLYYIMVPDVDAAVEKVKELGGQVPNGPMEVPGGDKVAQCCDPQGAAFALHSKPAA
jgi:predicted enzyme related to lactoylglutathione lyase